MILHFNKKEVFLLAKKIHSNLLNNNIDLIMLLNENKIYYNLFTNDKSKYIKIGILKSYSELKTIESVIVLGGDGTFLRAANLIHNFSIPIFGINMGRMGFLVKNEKKDLSNVLSSIISKNYYIESRNTLDVKVFNNNVIFSKFWAFNEMTIEKNNCKIIELTISIDGNQLGTIRCDGIIISTSTGSTAYAFSTGGPLLWPDVKANLVIPINPHAFFRPLIVKSTSIISIVIVSNSGTIWCDGRKEMILNKEISITINQSPKKIYLAYNKEYKFTDLLNTKLQFLTNKK